MLSQYVINYTIRKSLYTVHMTDWLKKPLFFIYRTEGKTELFGTAASNGSHQLMRGDYGALMERQLAGETFYPITTDAHME